MGGGSIVLSIGTRGVDLQVLVKLFATYREIVGMREVRVALPEGAAVGDLLDQFLRDHPPLGVHRSSMILALNEEFVGPDARLAPGDTVALLPPVSGGGAEFCRLQAEAIDSLAVIERVRDVAAGAVVVFLGTVRAEPGVGALDYEAYEPMALKQMEILRTAAKERFRITEVSIVHRIGRLRPGETSVVVACSAPHRQAAFEACEWAIEELKRIVPIWKAEGE